jgi:Cu+-exporting ATPase
MTTETFPVTGMTCASCVRRVEKAIRAVPGVTDVHVDLVQERATITHGAVAAAALADAVAAKGYGLVVAPAADGGAADLRRADLRLLLAWAFALPLLAPMAGIPVHLDWRLQAALAALAAFGCGGGFLLRAARLAWQQDASMDTLIAVGSLAAFVSGLVEGLSGAHHTSFEIAASLPAVVLLGKRIEAGAKHRATTSLTALLDLAPALAMRIDGSGNEHEVSARQLAPGDLVRVRPGQAIPVDGRIVAGAAEVEEALLTGEPLPVAKSVGDDVLAGAIVHGGSLDIAVRAAGSATWLARLANQVAEAKASRQPAQALADRISRVFVPVILVLAAAVFAAWWLLTGDAALAWRPAVTVLVIACPCALGLATPVALATALGSAARQGLLVRDAAALDRLAAATDLVLDKTGTLTVGRPRLRELRPVGSHAEAELRQAAAALERDSEHPLARAIRAGWSGALPPVEDWRAHPGGGVSGTIAGRRLRLGNAAFLGLALPAIPDDAIAVGLADEDGLRGVFLLADAMRPEAAGILARLRGRGIDLHLLSGDRAAAVAAFARGLPFATVAGDVQPAGKAERIAALQRSGRVVAFAGDGVNDAAALATADAGISLPGLDAAAASAPLNLHREGLQPLLDAHHLARRLRRIIRQNLAWAFAYNLVLVPLAAFGLLDRIGGPLLAGAAMGMSSLTVVLNALRLRRR